MAAKTPDSVVVESVGNLRKITATFSTNDIDDNDTWTSGIRSAVAWDVHTSIDGASDTAVDAYDATDGKFTFGSAANQTGRLVIWARGY